MCNVGVSGSVADDGVHVVLLMMESMTTCYVSMCAMCMVGGW